MSSLEIIGPDAQDYRVRAPLQEQRLLRDPDTYTTVFLCMLHDRLRGDDPKRVEYLEWEPSTLRDEIRRTWGVLPSNVNMSKILTGVTLLTTDRFYTSERGFVDLCNGLSGSGWGPEDGFDPADVLECCWGLMETSWLRPPLKAEQFHPAVPAYIEFMLKQEGYGEAPAILRVFGIGNDLIANGMPLDPDLSGAAFDAQREKTEDLEQALVENLHRLVQQMESVTFLTAKSKTRDMIQLFQQAAAVSQ